MTLCCDRSAYADSWPLSFSAPKLSPTMLFLQVRRLIAVNSVKKDFAALLSAMQGDKKKVAQLADLLERMMHLDPSRRLTAKECLKHPFIKEPKA